MANLKELIEKKIQESRYQLDKDIHTLLEVIKEQDFEFSKNEILDSLTECGRWTGQFSTPNKIAELISIISDIYNPQSVIDICCGTGNILSYFENLKSVKGTDINTDIIELAKYINPNVDFSMTDALEYDFGNDKYDLVVGQPPFNARMSDRRFLDIELIKKGLSLLNNNGVAIFIVSEGLLTNTIASNFRQEILSNFALDMVISLPIGAFLPCTSVKTSILVIRNGSKNQDIFMPEFKNNPLEIADNFKQYKGDFYLPISKITDRLDRNYYAPLEKIEEIIKGHKLIKLSNISEIISGRYFDRNSISSNGNYLIFSRKDKSFIDVVPDERCILNHDDIVVSLWNTKPDNEVFIYEDDSIKTVIPQLYAIIRPSTKYKEYLKTYLQTQDWKTIIQRYVMGSVQPRLSIQDLRQIEIPLLSEEELNELVSKTLRINNENRYYIQESIESLKSEKYQEAKDNIEKAFENADSETMLHREVYLQNIDRAEKLEEKNQQLDKKNTELNNLIAMFAHNFLGTLQCIRSNAEHENNPKIHLKTVKMMRGALTAFSIISADDDKLVEQLKQDNKGETNLLQCLANNLALAISQLLSKTNKDKIINLYLNYLQKTGQIQAETTGEDLRFNDDEWNKWDALQTQWDDEFNALFSEKVELNALKKWINTNFFTIEIIGFDKYPIYFKEYGITDSIFLVVLMETLVNALKYIDVKANKPLILTLAKENNAYQLSCENPSRQESYRGTHKGMDFLQTIAKKLNGEFINESTENNFKTTFIIPAELLD